MKTYKLKVLNGTVNVDIIAETKDLLLHRPEATSGTLSRHYILTLKNCDESLDKKQKVLKDLRICKVNNMSRKVCKDIVETFQNTKNTPSNSKEYINEIKNKAQILNSLSGSKEYWELFKD